MPPNSTPTAGSGGDMSTPTSGSTGDSAKKSQQLNPLAKEFTFNPGAKEFTPKNVFMPAGPRPSPTPPRVQTPVQTMGGKCSPTSFL